MVVPAPACAFRTLRSCLRREWRADRADRVGSDYQADLPASGLHDALPARSYHRRQRARRRQRHVYAARTGGRRSGDGPSRPLRADAVCRALDCAYDRWIGRVRDSHSPPVLGLSAQLSLRLAIRRLGAERQEVLSELHRRLFADLQCLRARRRARRVVGQQVGSRVLQRWYRLAGGYVPNPVGARPDQFVQLQQRLLAAARGAAPRRRAGAARQSITRWGCLVTTPTAAPATRRIATTFSSTCGPTTATATPAAGSRRRRYGATSDTPTSAPTSTATATDRSWKRKSAARSGTSSSSNVRP